MLVRRIPSERHTSTPEAGTAPNTDCLRASMNLYLSSYLIGDHPERLLGMAGKRGARMAIITNALDAFPFEAQLEFTRNRFDPDVYFAQHGFEPNIADWLASGQC